MTDLGRTIQAAECPARPPYRNTELWRGYVGDWRVTAVRIEGDPVPHCVAWNLRTGIAHAERIPGASSAGLVAWARNLPEKVQPIAPAAE